MTGMARKFPLTAITALAVSGVPATAHAAADPVNPPLTGRPASELSGLRDGESYYAEDPANGVRWAADLPGATWVPTAIGFGPIPAGEERCRVPENVRALWGLAVRQVLPTGGTRGMSPAMKTLVTAMVIAAATTVAFSPTSSAQPTDPAASPAFGSCDWVTTAEATDILGKPVTPAPSDDAAGSNDPRCYYAAAGEGIGVGISSELITPAASAVADRMLAHAATEPGAVTINGLGVNAVCVFEPNVTPPSTTIVVLLDVGRVYRSTAAYEYCDTVERFARLAIDRITT